MKLESVTTCETSGSFRTRAPIAFACSSDGASTWMALVSVLGSRLSSRYVAIDSVLGLCRLMGLKSKLSQWSSGNPATTAIAVPAIIPIRCRFMYSSTGASAEYPSGSGSPGGFSRTISAGRSVMVVAKATSMPHPAIWPNSDTPL